MNCYAIVNNGNQGLKGFGDQIILSLSKQKIFAKYRVFGRIIALESEQELSDEVLNSKHLYPCIFTGSKENDIYKSIKMLVEHATPTKNFAIRVDRRGNHDYDSTELARIKAGHSQMELELWTLLKNLQLPAHHRFHLDHLRGPQVNQQWALLAPVLQTRPPSGLPKHRR